MKCKASSIISFRSSYADLDRTDKHTALEPAGCSLEVWTVRASASLRNFARAPFLTRHDCCAHIALLRTAAQVLWDLEELQDSSAQHIVGTPLEQNCIAPNNCSSARLCALGRIFSWFIAYCTLGKALYSSWRCWIEDGFLLNIARCGKLWCWACFQRLLTSPVTRKQAPTLQRPSQSPMIALSKMASLINSSAGGLIHLPLLSGCPCYICS